MTGSHRNQHLITRALQRRFAGPAGATTQGHVAVVRRSDPRVRLVGTRVNGAEEWFIREDPARFEQTWGEIETPMTQVYAELDSVRRRRSRRPPLSATHEEAIKAFMALHFVRSASAKVIWQRALQTVAPRRASALRADGELLLLARQSGLFPHDINDDELAAAVAGQLDDPLREGGAFFAETLVDQLVQTRRWFAPLNLEIGVALQSEFVLPDVACSNWNADTQQGGPAQGVPLKDADAIVMPLGPWHIASLVTRKPASTWMYLNADRVATVNAALASVAIDSLTFRPGSGLEVAARSVWKVEAPTGC